MLLQPDGSYSYTLDQGFERLDDFSTFNFNGLDYSNDLNVRVDADGLAINFDTQDALAYINVDAEGDDSELIWMHELSVTSTNNNSGYAVVDIDVAASAYFFGDAEVGICDLEVNLDSDNAAAVASVGSALHILGSTMIKGGCM